VGLTLCLLGGSLYRRRSGRRRCATASEDRDDVPPQYVGAFVIVVGLGGVGSHAAALLAENVLAAKWRFRASSHQAVRFASVPLCDTG
jgi:hypothetical protein